MFSLSSAKMWVQSIEIDKDGNTVAVGSWSPNLPLKGGKYALGQYIVAGTGATAAHDGFIYVCVGSGASAAPPITVNDDRLGGTLASHASAHEYIANGTRKVLLSTNTGSAVTALDWVESATTINSIDYHYLLEGYVTYEAADANGTTSPGVPFNRFGLNNTIDCPATVTGLSGLMLNEVADSDPKNKTDNNVIRVNINLRI